MNDKVSVIVPVYKVEQYLDKCVESIVNQTYKNLEIILVDDGSPDNCPSLCDAWSKKDCRIIVIHKENGGLASARNAGLDIATGNYISFIDSDDYIDKDLYLDNLKIFKESDVDIVGFGINQIYEGKKNTIAMIDGLMSSEDAIKHLLLWDGTVRSFAWNKIYKKEIIGNIRFIDALKFGEDTPFVFSVLCSSYKYYQNALPYYFYLRRDNSLIGNEFNENKILTIKASQIIYNSCRMHNKKYIEFAECSIAFNCLVLIRSLYLTKKWRFKFYNSYLEIRQVMRSCSMVTIYKHFGLLKSLKFIVVRYAPFIYEMLCKLKNNQKVTK